MMAKSMGLFHLILVFFVSIRSINCWTNHSTTFNDSSQTSSIKGVNATKYRCSRYFYEIKQELASVIPLLDSVKDNYHSIYQALFPMDNLPSLYVKVTIHFLLDFQNGTKIKDKSSTKKLTWSEACTFVSVDCIGLDAMSFFSLGTIFPQRRQSELSLMLSPVCPNTTLYSENELWRNVVFMLQDIAINANLSDPTVNSVQCVVDGQEDDPETDIKSPCTASILHKIRWHFCCLVLVVSSILSIVVWVYLHNLLLYHNSKVSKKVSSTSNSDNAGQEEGDNIEATEIVQNSSNSDNTEQGEEKEKIKRKKIYLGVTFNMICYMSLFTLISISVNIRVLIGSTRKIYQSIHTGLLIFFAIVNACITRPRVKTCCRDTNSRESQCGCKCTCTFTFHLLFPNVYNTVHHLLWIVCGVITEPYWATPIVLLEALFVSSLVYVVYLCQRDVVHGENFSIGKKRAIIIIHLGFALICFWLVLFIAALIGYGRIVNVPTAGVIEIIATSIFIWIVNKSDLEVLKDFK